MNEEEMIDKMIENIIFAAEQLKEYKKINYQHIKIITAGKCVRVGRLKE